MCQGGGVHGTSLASFLWSGVYTAMEDMFASVPLQMSRTSVSHLTMSVI